MRRCRYDDWTAARHRHQPLQFGEVGGRRRNIELQIAGDDDVAAAEHGKAFRIDAGLRQANLELAKQCRNRAAHPPPARKRTMRHPPVDQRHRQTSGRARKNEIRPQVGFDEQRQARPPVIEKTRDIARRIVRDVLMNDVRRKTLGDDRRRSDRAGGQQDTDIERAQLLDQRRGRQHLADACAVNPDQRPVRPDILAQAAPFADARGIFLALLQPPLDQRRRKRNGHRGQPPVDAQRHRQDASHDPSPADGRALRKHDWSPRSGSLPGARAVLP